MNAEVYGDESKEPRCLSIFHNLFLKFSISRDSSGARSLIQMYDDLLGMYCSILAWHKTTITQRISTVELRPW